MGKEKPPASVGARQVVVVMRELSLDLLRALEAAVPCALADVAGDLAPDRVSKIAECIFLETKARFAVNAAATLLATGAGDRH